MSATAEKRREQAQERSNAREALQSIITRKTIIYTRTEYTRNQTDYVRVYVVSSGEIVDITYFVARAANRRMNDRGIAYGGGGYSKGLEAADDAWRLRFGKPLEQSYWRELS